MMTFDDRREDRLADLRNNPFVLLGITPATPISDLEVAHENVRQLKLATEQALKAAVGVVSDPSSRLQYELGYPLECTPAQVEMLLGALSCDVTESEQLRLANLLGPLSRLCWLSSTASRCPPGGEVLAAILDAQAAVGILDLYNLLKSVRSSAGLAAPSLVTVSQALHDLTMACHENLLAAYPTASQAAHALLVCCRIFDASHDRHRSEALAQLLSAYDCTIADLCHDLSAELLATYDAIDRQPGDPFLLDQLDLSFRSFIAVAAPLIFQAYVMGGKNNELEAVAERARQLLFNLSSAGNHKLAARVAKRSVEFFDLVPGIANEFAQTADVLEHLAMDTALNTLKEAVEQRDAEHLGQLDPRDFLDRNALPASDLWLAFGTACEATKGAREGDLPWLLMRDFALRLAARQTTLGSAQALVASLVQIARAETGNATILQALGEAHRQIQQRVFVQQRAQRRQRLGVALTLSICTAAVACFVLLGINNSRFAPPYSQLPRSEEGAHTSVAEGESAGEAIPPIGAGQHLSREFVRYCEFQKQRLRVIKRHLEWREDIAAYNTLANDYNSRCSNYFYRDADMNIVTGELAVRQQNLEAETERIMESWPWRAPAGTPTR
ncbi:hypothetical protein L6654_37805 [Bradyrhizobium sp. WYCCWR 13023]|uniref:Uncharacterized protein n=1 Tax=Bradyrhizobium zhengyangense TaxID=2911009 RepID=A0A9X1RJ81_9BRAD|nr:hypothetical protein [Bradyrhizobium zhengyangense]MCG2632373.1 hypothetical protein [Bradyrhizobium zhengyangense]